MDRLACVDVPALPLQSLLRRHPQWRELPVAVVNDDRPQGIILWANPHARTKQVLAGMSFAAGQTLASDLRAAVVEQSEIDDLVSELHLALCNASPRVEPNPAEPGVFWLDPTGMISLYGSLEQWARTLYDDLSARGFSIAVVVGFHRYRTYALARTLACRAPGSDRIRVLPEASLEAALAARVPLELLGLAPKLRDHLAVLGVRTLGQFLALPVAQLQTRLGVDAARLHALASDAWLPLQPRPLADPIEFEFDLEVPDVEHSRVLFALKRGLQRTLGTLARRGQAMSNLQLTLRLDHAPDHLELIEPAHPTLDAMLLMELIRLRLDALVLPAAVAGAKLSIDGIAATSEQLVLFRTQSRRDLDAGARALDRLRATFGDASVTHPKLRAAHLPEAGFTWERLMRPCYPRPRPLATELTPLIRRVLPYPLPLPPRPRHEPEAWLGPHGAVTRMHGPFRISGGWWVRTVERDYYYAETRQGEILWIYYDRPRRRWFLQGIVD